MVNDCWACILQLILSATLDQLQINLMSLLHSSFMHWWSMFDEIIWVSQPKPIGNGWRGPNSYKHICKVSFLQYGTTLHILTRPYKCGKFSSQIRGRHILGDIEHVWLLSFTRGRTCRSDTMMKQSGLHNQNQLLNMLCIRSGLMLEIICDGIFFLIENIYLSLAKFD